MQTTKTIFAVLVGLLLSSWSLRAQEEDIPLPRPDVGASPIGVVIAPKGGVVLSSPRGTFPSIIVGEGGTGTGDFPSSNARTATGYRSNVAFLIPFNQRLGLSIDAGLMQYLVEYQPTATSPALQYHAQTAQLAFGLQGNLYFNAETFHKKRGEGLRAVYLDGGFDIGVASVANRVEVTSTDSTGQQSVRVGSFENNEPLRTPVALRLAAGLRFAFSPHVELQAEAGYSLALNDLFSSTVLVDNTFTVDHLLVQLGVGYRF